MPANKLPLTQHKEFISGCRPLTRVEEQRVFSGNERMFRAELQRIGLAQSSLTTPTTPDLQNTSEFAAEIKGIANGH